MRDKQLSSELHKKIIELYNSGYSVNKIANKLNLKYKTVYMILYRFKLLRVKLLKIDENEDVYCNSCKQYLIPFLFYKNINQCKKCISEKLKNYYNERGKETRGSYYKKNRDKLLAYQKEYRRQNKEKTADYGKEYRKKNKDKVKEYQKKYRERK